MAIEVHCVKCGHANRLGSLFCAKCRAKLEFDAEPPGMGEVRYGARRKIVAAILLGLLALVTALGVMAFLPARMEVAAGTPAARQMALRKLQLLKHSPAPVRQTFTAMEVNALLPDALARMRDAGRPILAPRARAAGITIKPNALIVEYLATVGPVNFRDVNFGPLELRGSLVYVSDEKHGLRLHRAWLGYVYLPGPLARLAAWPLRDFARTAAAELLPAQRALTWAIEDGKLVAQTQ